MGKLPDTIVFLVSWPITAKEAKSWGFKTFARLGISVRVFDVSCLVHGEGQLSRYKLEYLAADYIYKIASYRDLANMLAAAQGAKYIDYMLGLGDINARHEKVYRLLKRHGIKYSVVAAGALPVVSPAGQGKAGLQRFLAKVKQIRGAAQIIDYLFRKTVIALRRRGLLYPLPVLLFGGDSAAVNIFLAKYGLPASMVKPIHSLDYDVYLACLAKAACGAPAAKTCVVLDEAIVEHADWGINGIEPIGLAAYASQMNRFLDWLEVEKDLQPIIAAHPDSDLATLKQIYPTREIFQGKSAELVAASTAVVAHYSTACSFAVLFGKPLLLVKTAEIKQHPYINYYIDVMADALGVMPVYIGEPAGYRVQDTSIPAEKYQQYLYRYVKSRNAPEKMVWEIVAATLFPAVPKAH